MSALQTGDAIEYGVSYFVREGGEEVWVKLGATTTVQSGEAPDEARARLSDFVNEELQSAIEDVKRT